MKIYPNPSDGKIWINEINSFYPVHFKAYNNNGVLVKSGILDGANTCIDMSDHIKGIYYFKLENSKTERFFKILIQ